MAKDDIVVCNWVFGFANDRRHNAALIDFGDSGVDIYKIEPLKLDIRARFEGTG